MNDKEKIYLDIKKECEHLFDFKIHKVFPLSKGWLNLKWHVETTKGSYVVKQFNPQRYPHDKLKKIEKALIYQQIIHNEGFSCPKVLSIHNQAIFQTELGDRFMLMKHESGETISPGEANKQQMYDAGKVLGELHRLLNSKVPSCGEKTAFDIPTREVRIKEWEERLAQALHTDDRESECWIRQQINVTNRYRSLRNLMIVIPGGLIEIFG